ncbi:MAG: phosphodiester glycosidase family protein [Chlamydiae bacterium]|nr:phosphodiester glycosidase family protein [Chlamydiota bacterium]
MKLFVALFPLILLANPIAYEHVKMENLSIHVLEVNPNKVDFELINCDGLEKPSLIGEAENALAAFNGGFYLKDGKSFGVLKIKGNVISPTDRQRGAIGFTPFIIDRLGSDAEANSFLPLFHSEQKEIWNSCQNILGGAPLLLVDFQIPNFEEECVRKAFVEQRYSRTAIGLKENGDIVIAIIEGPQSGKSLGMTLAELAEFMLSRGCKDAINLCGGESSALYYNKEVIYPLPIEEKRVGNVVIIKERLCL